MATKKKNTTKRLSKAAFIRSLPSRDVHDVVFAGKKAGYTFTEKYVHTVRSAARGKIPGKREREMVGRGSVAQLRKNLDTARETILLRNAAIKDLENELTELRTRYRHLRAAGKEQAEATKQNTKLRKLLAIIHYLIDIESMKAGGDA